MLRYTLLSTFFLSYSFSHSYSKLTNRVASTRTAALSTTTTSDTDDDKDKAAKEKFFLENIRPVLFETCLKCHGPEKSENGLRVDSRNALIEGGESGEAIVPEKPQASLLLKAIQYAEQDLQMPPDAKLEDKTAEAFEKWIKEGAVWAEPPKNPK
jgi:uncharacterized membrane protein